MKLLDKVPYFSQLDNLNNPYGSCNVTSVAMSLAYFGIVGNGSQKQLEDQLYQDLLNAGKSRHDPNDLAWLINRYPTIKDIFRPNGTFDDIRKAIDNGNPCILHGYFTRSGHIITIVGYTGMGLIVNDPYGEYYRDGYDTAATGKHLQYSYELIAETCSPESQNAPRDLWLHVVTKR